jgi:predicted DsbA family dithiol-disulfide isomerase
MLSEKLTDRGLSPRSDYIQIRAPVYISHSAGRYAVKRFRKAQCPIIERLTNSLMMNGRNNGKKLMAVRIVAHAFEIVRPLPSILSIHICYRF